MYLLFIDWIKNSEKYFSEYWPGWDARITETNAKEEYGIRDIGTCGYKAIIVQYVVHVEPGWKK